MGKTRYLSKRTGDTMVIFHAKMGTIKDKTSKDLIEAEEIKKRCLKCTELHKNINDPGDHKGVVTHLELNILECEIKWALRSITTNEASGDGGIPTELFQILTGDTGKVLHSICRQIWKTQQWPLDWKNLVFIPVQGRTMPHSFTHFTS